MIQTIRSNRVLFGSLVTVGSTVLALLLVFAIDRATNGSEILGDVSVGGVSLGGLGEFEATETVRSFETDLTATPVPVVVAGRMFELDPRAIGFEVDEQAIVAAAMDNGRDGNLAGQLAWWLGHFGGSETEIEIPYTYDEDALRGVIAEWQRTGIDDPAHPGDVAIADGDIVFSYPRAGTGIEIEEAVDALAAVLATLPRPTVELTTNRIEPDLTAADIDAVVAEVEQVLAGPVTLTALDLGREVTIPRRVLADALVVRRSDTTVGGTPEFNLTLLGEPMVEYVAGFFPYLETEATDAELVIADDDTVSIIPSIPVSEPDPVAIPQAAWAAANSPSRTAEMTYRTGREAELSTAMVEAWGVREKISEFTTGHPCCQSRVINIQRIADEVDGAWILPGETWSLNDHVGKRTVADGYVCAGALIGGEVVQEGEICIGGGTSQFTTTLYNAVFFAGLEDVYHFPHTAYFSRYPEGREATLGFPGPDLIFRNNTPNVVVIKTEYTDKTITVKMFGDNGGIDVEAGLSNRFNITQPVKNTRAATDDEDVPICTLEIVSPGSNGFTVTIWRWITYPDGTTTTETWATRYQGLWEITAYDPSTPPATWGTEESPCKAGGGLKDPPPDPDPDP
jgi:vancomycin resistance protein YoaR